VIYLLDFRGADVGGPVVPGRIVQMGGLFTRLGTESDLRLESKITFLLHGFNCSRQRGRELLLRLAEKLPSVTDGAIVAVLWPGDHWVRFISYPFEGKDADDSAFELSRYIVRGIKPGTELSFVSHSLGARVVMETVERLIGRDYQIRQICLMAAAIDDYSLSDPEEYRIGVSLAERVAVLASKRDRVLKYAYPVGDLLQAFVFFWKDESGLALGYHGPKPIEGHSLPKQVYPVQIPDERKTDHGDYLPNHPPTPNQLSSARFANEVLQGAMAPKYS